MTEKNLAEKITGKLNEALGNSFGGSEVPVSYPKLKLATSIYAKKQKRNRMAKKSRAINRKK